MLFCCMTTKNSVFLLTLHVFQLLDVVHSISGVDVEPVTITEVLQDVSGVESGMSVIHQLRDAQRAHRSDFKPTSLEKKGM